MAPKTKSAVDKQLENNEAYQKRLEALKPFQFPKGVSANPKGRPPAALSLANLIRTIGEEKVNGDMTRVEAMIRQIYQDAIEGSESARNMLMDRGWGTLVQKTQSLNLSTQLPNLAKEMNIDEQTIRADPLLLAVFTASGVIGVSETADEDTPTGGDSASAIIEQSTSAQNS